MLRQSREMLPMTKAVESGATPQRANEASNSMMLRRRTVQFAEEQLECVRGQEIGTSITPAASEGVELVVDDRHGLSMSALG